MRREDGKIYVVAADTSGGLHIENVEGGWGTLQHDVGGIVSIDPAELESVPDLKEWLGTAAASSVQR